MSKKRNQVQFTKPEDPKFLKLIKQQAGYRDEGPSIDSKRAKYDSGDEGSDYSDKDEELPQVVVVKSGDLTADEAEREKKRLELENNTKPADLTERIVFKSKSKPQTFVADNSEATTTAVQGDKSRKSSKSSRKIAKETKSKLSFAFDEDDEDAEE